jgi:hypothetical protein
VSPGCAIRMAYPNGALTGVEKYCVFREIGYFLGLEFDPGNRCSLKSYRPQHLLDPRRLVTQGAVPGPMVPRCQLQILRAIRRRMAC